MHGFMSPYWFREMREAFEGVELPPVDLSVQFDVTVGSTPCPYHLVVGSGRLLAVGPGPLEAPDLCLQQPLPVAAAYAVGRDEAALSLRETRVVVRGADGMRRRRPAPLDDAENPRMRELPRVPNLSFTMAVRLTQTAFGDVSWVEDWRDGQRVGWRLVAPDAAVAPSVDIQLWCTLPQYYLARAGRLDARESLAGGAGAGGEWPLLMCLAGLLEEPAYLAAWDGGPHWLAQARLGEIICSSGYREAVDRVCRVTDLSMFHDAAVGRVA